MFEPPPLFCRVEALGRKVVPLLTAMHEEGLFSTSTCRLLSLACHSDIGLEAFEREVSVRRYRRSNFSTEWSFVGHRDDPMVRTHTTTSGDLFAAKRRNVCHRIQQNPHLPILSRYHRVTRGCRVFFTCHLDQVLCATESGSSVGLS